MHGLTRADIHSALWKSRALVKTSCMRGTLHLLAAADFPVYIAALKSSRARETLRIMSRYGVGEKEACGVMAAVVEVLRAGPMTRRELTKRVLSLGIVGKKAKKWFELSWWGVAQQGLVEGLICYGPNQGQKATIVRVDQWLPDKREVSEREAQRVLLRRYLSAYGPATLQDFSHWTGFSMKDARAVWELLEEELAEVHMEGKKGFILRKDLDELKKCCLDDDILRLLPSFDPYMLGHADKSGLVVSRDYKRVYRQAGWISPVVLLNGRVIGTWTYTRRGKRLSFEMSPFQKLSKIIRAGIEEEAASLGVFLEAPWEVKYKISRQ